MRRLLPLLAALCLCLPLKAQFAADTTFRVSGLIVPAVLGGTGLAVHYLGHQAVEEPVYLNTCGLLGPAGDYLDAAGDWLRFAPAAAHLGLGLAGVRARRPFSDRVIESAIAHLCCVGGAFVSKRLFRGLRPDGSSYDSFPSGHASIAFTGAELMRADYGPWWGVGAYALSSGVALTRLEAGEHWLGDILAGAGLGILCARVGVWLTDPVKSLLGLPESSWDGLSGKRVQVALVPGADPLSGTPTAGLSVVF
jgi:membrane-associated phospholipid phosphatase